MGICASTKKDLIKRETTEFGEDIPENITP